MGICGLKAAAARLCLEPRVRPELIDALQRGDDLLTVSLGLGEPAQINGLTGTGAPT